MTQSTDSRSGRRTAPRAADDVAPAACTVALTKDQVVFLIDAIEHYERTSCPLHGAKDGCQMLTWAENPATGVLEMVCPDSCRRWREFLAAQVSPAALPVPPELRFIPAD